MTTGERSDHHLRTVMEEAQAFGLIGPGPLSAHLVHAEAFGAVALGREGGLAGAGPGPGDGPLSALDLGSGGGLPGLVLARRWPRSRWTLLDAKHRATGFTEGAVARLGLGERVTVIEGRAENLGRGSLRGRAALVTARGFARPAVTAECAAPFLDVGGLLVVSEPPDSEGERWDGDGLAELGLTLEGVYREAGFGFVLLRMGEPCPDRYPRRVGVPHKRPLW